MICRRRQDNVVARKRYCGAVWCVEAIPFNDPCRPGVAANAKANSGRRDDNLGICRVRAYLMNIAVDIDGGLPGSCVIH
jgi:hypothetical protein